MRVLLISHPYKHRQKPDFPPIGIAYLGAVVSAQGHDVLLIDGGLRSVKDILAKSKQFDPDIVGVTCWTVNRTIAWNLCIVLKKKLSNVFLIVGGPHASFYPEHIFVKTPADAVIIGEGEETICELLSTMEKGGDLSTVKGLALKQENGTITFTAKRPFIEQLDSLPFPYYLGFDNFSFVKYSGLAVLRKPTAPIITSRGCVFDCTYCGSVNFWGLKWRSRSAENVVAEINHLVKDMGARSIYIFDDNFPVSKKRAMEICQRIIDSKLDIQWACCSHVKMINKELLDIMRQSGCVSIDFGMESGSDVILKNINKNQNRKDIETAFKLAHKAGIKPRAYLIVGSKGETTSTIDETVELTGKIEPHASIGATLFWLLPGTQSFLEARTNGFIDDDYWLKFDDVPINLQEHTHRELVWLRKRLMWGVAKQKGGIVPMISFYLKTIYYKYPFLSRLRSLIPDRLK